MSKLTLSQISLMILENGSLGMRRFVDFWYLLISIKARVPGLYLLLLGVPSPPLGLFPFAPPTCFPFLGVPARGVEVAGLTSFLGNFFPMLFIDFPWRGALPPVDFLAVGWDFFGFMGDFVAPFAGVSLGEPLLLLFWLWSFFFFIFSAKLSSNVVWVRNPELTIELKIHILIKLILKTWYCRHCWPHPPLREWTHPRCLSRQMWS